MYSEWIHIGGFILGVIAVSYIVASLFYEVMQKDGEIERKNKEIQQLKNDYEELEKMNCELQGVIQQSEKFSDLLMKNFSTALNNMKRKD